MTQQEAIDTQEVISIMETPKLTKRFATYFVAVLVGAYVFGRMVGGENAAFYFCMIAPAVWLVSAFVYQSKLKSDNNREAYDDMEAEMHTAKNQLTQAVVLIRKLQSETTTLQSASLELRTLREKLQSVEALAQSQTDRAVELDRLLASEKQSRANERAIALEEIANATEQLATVKANAVKAQAIAVANAVANAEKQYAPLLELRTAYLEYSAGRTIVNTATNTAEQKAEGSRAMKAAKETLDKFVIANTPKLATV